jgi:DNA polymerase elongation subunit (family B)
MKADGFTNNETFNFARLVFNNFSAMRSYRKLFEENYLFIPTLFKQPYNFKTYEANLPPMLRCFHIRDISGCSWVSVENYKQIKKEEEKKTYCDIELSVDWRKISPIQKDYNAPLRIASFDIECYSHDGKFPEAKRSQDKIIQIGTTYTYLGESDPYRQHIVCLGETDPVEGAIVEWYNDEKEMVEAWVKEIIRSDCDIITGYNIFYFDENYIHERAVEQLYNVNSDERINVNYLSKMKDYECRWKEMTLASSALGENKLNFWVTPGRVHIDLMKDVQKNNKLSSYRLDSVASNFIRGQINSLEKIKKNLYRIYCTSVNDIYLEDYIHLELIRSFVTDYVGDKCIVKHIDKKNKTLDIFSNDDLENELDFSLGKVFWSQAKDDVSAKDIFNLWASGDPAKRSKVAKYCVKDCRLVNLLINKLEVVTKNIEFANLSFTPLSYLFVRGQGILIFSACLKFYRNYKYLFPVIKRKVTFEYMTNIYEGEIIRSPYTFNEEEDSEEDPEVLKKKKGANYEYLIKVKRLNGKKYKPRRGKNDLVKFNKYKMEFIKKDGYEGAIVFDPIPGVVYEALATKDFASLYPSCMRQKNMSHETIVLDENYDNIEGVTYYNANFKENDGTIQWRRFAKTDKPGVLPTVLELLFKTRKNVKKQMKIEKNPEKYSLLDAKQLAIKLLMNSIYGQLGASTSPIVMRDIAACTTSTGRENLIIAKKNDEEVLPWILNGIREGYNNNKLSKVKKILDKELEDPNNEKLKQQIEKYVTKDLDGIIFTPIIRYGDTDSIFSSYSFRENSVLLNKNDSLVLWKEIIKFSKIMIKPFIPIEHTYLWNELHDEYYYYESIKKLALPEGPKVLPKTKHHNDILPVEERFKQFLKEYMEESYFPWLWTLQDIFTREFRNEDDYIDAINVKLWNMGNSQIEKMRLVAEDISYDQKKNHENIINDFIKNTLKNNHLQPYWDISKKRTKLKIKIYKGGKIITDKRSLILTMEMGIISDQLLQSRLDYPQVCEYEKTFWPFLQLTKKRYAGHKYEFDINKYKKDVMGLVLKRRDNAPIVKEICGGIINRLLIDKDPVKALKFTKECLDKMFEGYYDIKYFLTSKTLKSKESYKDWSRIAHVVLAERIGIRNPGNKPQSGDRIQFAAVKIENETKDTLQGDKIETPEFIKQNNLELDYLFYTTNQIMKPALQFLNLAIKGAEKMFDEIKIRCENEKKGRTNILKFCKKVKKKKKKKLDDKINL